MSRPVVLDREHFTAATWNVYHGTPVAEAADVARRLLRDGVTVVLGQEFTSTGMVPMLRDHGLHAFRVGQYLLAWCPRTWAEEATTGVRLADTLYARVGGRPRVPLEAARAQLRHRLADRTIDALSYHLPAGVQRGGPAEDSVPRRVTALREAMITLRDLAASSSADAVLFGGDDNVDEANGPGWDFMRRTATGLRQVRAPEPTHGSRERGRRIDDFRVRGLVPVEGWVRAGGGDHRAHVHRFAWKGAR